MKTSKESTSEEGLGTISPSAAGPKGIDAAVRSLGPKAFAVLLGVAFILISLLQDGFPKAPAIGLPFPDGDDALRLVQIREFMATGRWFAPVISNIGDTGGMASHWSRLLDLPISASIAALSLLLPRPTAEWITILLWPKLVLASFITAFAYQASVEGGRKAALLALGFCSLSLYCMSLFQLGRIDHHNVQIACAIMAILIATSGTAKPRSALVAGLLAGFGLAIGYEALPVIILLAALLALAGAWSDEWLATAENFAGGLALCLSVSLAATMKPGDWLTIPCDALGLNIVAGSLAGCLAVMASAAARKPFARLVILAFGGAIAAGIAYALAPACIGGPFALHDQRMQSLWLEHMNEAMSLIAFAEQTPVGALAAAISLTVLLLAQAIVSYHVRTTRNLIRFGLLILLTLLATRYQKLAPYAQFLGFFCLAQAICLLPERGRLLSPTLAMVAAFPLATPNMLIGLTTLAMPAATAGTLRLEGRGCREEASFATLRNLPAARILSQQDLGAYLALMPQHQVLVGNYHRLDREIMHAANIFNGALADARSSLDQWRVDIVVTCAGESFYKTRPPSGSLADHLLRGDQPVWLKPIELGLVTSLRAYTVVKD